MPGWTGALLKRWIQGNLGQSKVVLSVSALYPADPSGVAGIGLAVCWVGAGLGRLQAAEESSRGGKRLYPFSSVPSTDVRAAEAEGRMRAPVEGI